MFSHEFGLRQAEPGDCSGEAIPVPISNTEVKLSSAENTEGAAPRQDRSSPGSLASWGIFLRAFERRMFRYPPNMEAQQFTPCPWLLDDAGAIEPGRPHVPSRCGADPARGELTNQIRERRCLTGSACEIRDLREAALGPLAATLAPGQPVGDAALLYGDEPVQPRASRPWGRPLLVAALAALLVIGSEPLAGALGPVIDSLIGAADASAEPSVEPSDSVPPTATPTATPSPSLTPTPAPTATPAPSSDTGTTYVVKRNDTLSGICLKIGGGEGCVKAIMDLNSIEDARTIQPGQVLKLP